MLAYRQVHLDFHTSECIPGIGSAFNTAVRSQNYNLVMMLALLFVFMTLFASTLVDILTAALDPRIKLER